MSLVTATFFFATSSINYNKHWGCVPKFSSPEVFEVAIAILTLGHTIHVHHQFSYLEGARVELTFIMYGMRGTIVIFQKRMPSPPAIPCIIIIAWSGFHLIFFVWGGGGGGFCAKHACKVFDVPYALLSSLMHKKK